MTDRSDSNPPICAECRYCHSSRDEYLCQYFCGIITGEPIACWKIREKSGPCGIEGELFKPKPEPKPSFFRKLINRLKG